MIVRFHEADERTTSTITQSRRMNPFQQLMWRWRELAPYQVVDILTLDGTFDPDRWRTSAGNIFMKLGLPSILGSDGLWSVSSRLASVEVQSWDAPEDQQHPDLARIACSELQRPFAPDASWPIRFHGMSSGDQQHIAMTFDHWFLDGQSAASLFAMIAADYVGQSTNPDSYIHRQDAPGLVRSLGRWTSWTRWPRLTLESIRRLRALRACFSCLVGDREDLGIRTRWLELPADAIARMKRRLSGSTGTVNDFLLAALGRSILTETPERHREPRRRRIAISCVTDLRPLMNRAIAESLGMYLGTFPVFFGTEPEPTFQREVQKVHEQTHRVKMNRLDLACLVEMTYSNFIWSQLPRREQLRQLTNNNPVAAGLSNLRLNDEWFGGRLAGMVRSYVRTVPTGGTTPLAVGVTTLLGRMTISLTERVAGYSKEQADQIASRFQRELWSESDASMVSDSPK